MTQDDLGLCINRFIGLLQGLAQPGRENRGALAHLRRGLGPPGQSAPETWAVIGNYLPAKPQPWRDACFFLVGALFGLHPRHEGGRRNMGDTFRRIADAQNDRPGQPPRDALQKRFIALLKSHRDDLHVHLRHAVSLAKGHDVAVNYRQLLWDLISWDSDRVDVRQRWARRFWSPAAPASEEQSAETAGV